MDNLIKRVKDECSKISCEEVDVEVIKGIFYVFCSELGTLRLFMKYTNKGKSNINNRFDVGYSDNFGKHFFRMELPF